MTRAAGHSATDSAAAAVTGQNPRRVEPIKYKSLSHHRDCHAAGTVTVVPAGRRGGLDSVTVTQLQLSH